MLGSVLPATHTHVFPSSRTDHRLTNRHGHELTALYCITPTRTQQNSNTPPPLFNQTSQTCDVSEVTGLPRVGKRGGEAPALVMVQGALSTLASLFADVGVARCAVRAGQGKLPKVSLVQTWAIVSLELGRSNTPG